VKRYLLQNTEVTIHEFGLEVSTEKAKPMFISECKKSSESEDK